MEGVANWRQLHVVQQWNVWIKGKHHQEVDKALLIQAVVALARQLRSEARDLEDEVHNTNRGEDI